MTYSACLELLFVPETKTFAKRFGLAKEAGFEAVEFWNWRDKNLDAVEDALNGSGLTLTSFVTEPMAPLTDPNQREVFLKGLVDSAAVARRLGARWLIAQAGNQLETYSQDRQHISIVEGLKQAVDVLEGSGITLVLEPLNTRVDHPGYYLDHTAEGLDIIEEVGDPAVRLLYDIYHSAVMGEEPREVLNGRVDLVGYVHLADAPGRHEPGSGRLDWFGHLNWLSERGYDGYIGLEYLPSSSTTESLRLLHERVKEGGVVVTDKNLGG